MDAKQSKSVTKRNLTLGVYFVCLGLAFLSLWKSNQLIVGQTFDFQEEAAVKACPRAAGALHLSSVHAKKCPCLIAVTNSVTYHFEILESIAAQLPLHYLNLNNLDCDTSSLVFDYFTVQYRPPPKRWKFWKLRTIWKSLIPNPRSVSFMSYFESEIHP